MYFQEPNCHCKRLQRLFFLCLHCGLIFEWPLGIQMYRTQFHKLRVFVLVSVQKSRPYLYSLYWAGTSLQWKLLWGVRSNAKLISWMFSA